MSDSCTTCLLWRRRVRAEKGEATEYQGHRPCGSLVRPSFQGSQVMSPSGKRLLTGPQSSCVAHSAPGRGEER